MLFLDWVKVVSVTVYQTRSPFKVMAKSLATRERPGFRLGSGWMTASAQPEMTWHILGLFSGMLTTIYSSVLAGYISFHRNHQPLQTRSNKLVWKYTNPCNSNIISAPTLMNVLEHGYRYPKSTGWSSFSLQKNGHNLEVKPPLFWGFPYKSTPKSMV